MIQHVSMKHDFCTNSIIQNLLGLKPKVIQCLFKVYLMEPNEVLV